MGTSYSANREVGVKLDQEALYDWRALHDPEHETDYDELLVFAETPHEGLSTDTCGYLMGYDGPIYFLKVDRLSVWGELWAYDWLLEDEFDKLDELTGDEISALQDVARELGTTDPRITAFWAISVG